MKRFTRKMGFQEMLWTKCTGLKDIEQLSDKGKKTPPAGQGVFFLSKDPRPEDEVL